MTCACHVHQKMAIYSQSYYTQPVAKHYSSFNVIIIIEAIPLNLHKWLSYLLYNDTNSNSTTCTKNYLIPLLSPALPRVFAQQMLLLRGYACLP